MSAALVIPFQNFIGGEFRESRGESFVPSINPSNRADVIGHVADSSQEEVDSAVRAASSAWPRWRAAAASERAQHLRAWARAIEERGEELAQSVCREVGKPIAEARGEVARCAAILYYYAGEAVRSVGDVIPAQVPGALQYTQSEPLGVVAIVTPWNFPLAIPVWKAAPALAFGNTVVWKPSEKSGNVSVLLAETAAKAKLPSGTFNMVHGSGRVGAALLDREGVSAVSFTGSTEVGSRVAACAAKRNIRFQIETGGKNVAIVSSDADLDLAAKLVASGAMRYAGQKCTATSRVVVEHGVETAFLSKLAKEMEALPLGPVTDARAAIGPLISEESQTSLRRELDSVNAERMIELGIPDEEHFRKGFFFPPTVLGGIAAVSSIACKELFGPVLAFFLADDFDHAIEIANRTPFGLSATLFTRNIGKALAYVDRIQAGMVRVNQDTTGVDPHAPFGGMKASGSGGREQGRAAFHFYTQIKTVEIRP
jgi:alpha-ketoglutaric semialdehyde dehydrogenase